MFRYVYYVNNVMLLLLHQYHDVIIITVRLYSMYATSCIFHYLDEENKSKKKSNGFFLIALCQHATLA